MKVSDLAQYWANTGTAAVTQENYAIRLPVDTAAKIEALAELYPGHSVDQLITDLLGAALEELETGLPYVRGDKVSGIDEMGDPMYEDVGPTPRYLRLAKQHLQRIKKQLD